MTRSRPPSRLPALLPAGATLSTIKAATLPGLPRFLMLGAYHGGRVGVYAAPPETLWGLNTPDLSLPQAEQLERRAGAGFLEGSTLTLKVPGHRPAVLSIRSVRVLRECIEALEVFDGVPFPADERPELRQRVKPSP